MLTFRLTTISFTQDVSDFLLDPEAICQALRLVQTIFLLRPISVPRSRNVRIEPIGHAANQVVIGKHVDPDVPIFGRLDHIARERLARMQLDEHLRLAPEASVKPVPTSTNSNRQPSFESSEGSVTLNIILPRRGFGLPTQKLMPLRPAIRPRSPPAPGTGITLRWPTLLSLGTSRHSGTVSPAVKLSTFDASPSAVTTISMQS